MPAQANCDKPQDKVKKDTGTGSVESMDFDTEDAQHTKPDDTPKKEIPAFDLEEDNLDASKEAKADNESISEQQSEPVEQVSKEKSFEQKPLTGTKIFPNNAFPQYKIPSQGHNPKAQTANPVNAGKPKKKKRWISRFLGVGLLAGGGIYGINQVDPNDIQMKQAGEDFSFHIDLSDEVEWAQVSTKDMVASVEQGLHDAYNSTIVAGVRARIAGPTTTARFITTNSVELTSLAGHFNRGIVLTLGEDYCSKIVVVATGEDQINVARELASVFNKAGMTVDTGWLNGVDRQEKSLKADSVYGLCVQG